VGRRDVTGIRALSIRAEAPAGIVRRAVDELGVASLDSADYHELVSARAGELADRLRADGSRARSFARELRESASRLEEAIVQWGPTLVEDDEAAGLLNLLPDIVDSARAAADAITSPVDDGWTDERRRQFEGSLLEILESANEFERGVEGRARRL
jgi:hypothetical protein